MNSFQKMLALKEQNVLHALDVCKSSNITEFRDGMQSLRLDAIIGQNIISASSARKIILKVRHKQQRQ